MQKEEQQKKELLLKETQKNLLQNGFSVKIAATNQEALSLLKQEILPNDTIGFGGSRTLEQIGFFDAFKNYPNFIDRGALGLDDDEKLQRNKEALTANVFLSSVNAISTNGDLILIDKNGNRNAAATFGPKKRIFVIGWNKINHGLTNALYYAQNTAAVQNNLRFQTDNPCTITGRCMDCHSATRLCSVTTILSRSVPVHSVLVLFIKSDLGF